MMWMFDDEVWVATSTGSAEQPDIKYDYSDFLNYFICPDIWGHLSYIAERLLILKQKQKCNTVDFFYFSNQIQCTSPVHDQQNSW